MNDDPERKCRDFAQRLAVLRPTDPGLYLAGMDLVTDIRDPDFRHVRSECLHTLVSQLAQACRMVDFRDEIVVRPEGVYVRIDGILLETLSQRLYLKASGKPQHSVARGMNEVLARHGITPTTLVDVGANYGEVSLWFAQRYPAATILSIEPVQANRAVFERNRAAQSFATRGIELIPLAVLDRTGTVEITAGVSTMNRVTDQKREGTETVGCERLANLLRQRGIDAVDFIKVDIEGAEPRLANTVTELGSRVRAWVFEFSKFAPLDDYLDLADALHDAGFQAYAEDGITHLPHTEALRAHLQHCLAPREVLVTNLWFFGR